MHHHLRDGVVLPFTVACAAKQVTSPGFIERRCRCYRVESLHLVFNPAMPPTSCSRQFNRAIIMPNLVPPVTTTAQALAYRDRILAALPPGEPDVQRA